MDIQTTLDIIKMIDAKIKNIDFYEDEYYDQYDPANIRDKGKYDVLTEIKNHLQSFIEAELNATELQSRE
jgi:hypothetical protein